MPPLSLAGLKLDGDISVSGGLAYEYTGNGSKLTIETSTEWNTTVRHSAIVTFQSSIDAANFFTSGGEIRMSASLSAPTTPPGRDYALFLERIGTVIFSNNMTSSFGIGTGTNFGFIDASLEPLDSLVYIFNASNASIHEQEGGMDYGDVLFSASVTKISAVSYRFSLRFTYDQGSNIATEIIDGTLKSMFDEKRYVSLPSPTYVRDN